MANKPVWIVCSNREWLDAILDNLSIGQCPPPLKDYRDCPVGKDGDAMICTECWCQYIDCEATSDE